MKTMTITAVAIATIALTGCHSRQDPETQPGAPHQRPIALDPHPPMRSADIDAIVDQHRQKPSPAATNNQGVKK